MCTIAPDVARRLPVPAEADGGCGSRAVARPTCVRCAHSRVVALHVVVEHGLNLAEVASTVSNRVAYEVGRLTGLPVRAVEVHVDDVRTGGK